MELSKEDKDRIIAEEKLRIKVEEEHSNDLLTGFIKIMMVAAALWGAFLMYVQWAAWVVNH